MIVSISNGKKVAKNGFANSDKDPLVVSHVAHPGHAPEVSAVITLLVACYNSIGAVL